MPIVLLPSRASVARSIVDKSLENTSLEERPQRKIFWNDEFETLTELKSDLKRLPSSQIPQKRMCRIRAESALPAYSRDLFGESGQAVGRRATTFDDLCFGPGLSDGMDDVFMVACMLLLLNGVAMVIYLRLQRWRPRQNVRKDQFVAASIVVGPDLETGVRSTFLVSKEMD